jgi:phenylpyruvate tautomerase PptA (4-oxalocrotonate tautomerase family)
MDPALTSVTIEQLEPATWYFAVRALTSTGNQSEYSGEVSKLVR